MPPDPLSDDTRDRLLREAGREFARRGYTHASLRDICTAADANVSVVKYPFGSKEGLYLAVWEVASERMQSSEPMPSLTPDADPEAVLQDFVAWFMRLVITNTEAGNWTGDLLAHETLSPTPGAMEVFVKRCCVPVRDELKRIVRAICGDALTPKRTDDVVYALIAMCINPKHSESIYAELGDPVPRTKAAVNRVASTVAALAIGGLRGLRDREVE